MTKTFYCPQCHSVYRAGVWAPKEKVCQKCGENCISVIYTPKWIYAIYALTFFIYGLAFYGITSVKFGIGNYGIFSLFLVLVLYPILAIWALLSQPKISQKVSEMFKEESPKKTCNECNRKIPLTLKVCPFCKVKQ